MQKQYRGSILRRRGDKNLKTFAPCYSKSPPPVTRWYNALPYGFLGLEISTPIAESRRGLGFVYIISMFTLERSIVLSPITLYLYINTSFPHRNNNWKWEKERKRKERRITNRKPCHSTKLYFHEFHLYCQETQLLPYSFNTGLSSLKKPSKRKVILDLKKISILT